MTLVPKWLFRLFYLSGLALVLMCSFVIIQEFFREPVNYECVLESGDGEEWNRKIKEEQEARRLEWASLSQKEVAVELDHRLKERMTDFVEASLKSDKVLSEPAFVYKQWGLSFLAILACWLIFLGGYSVIWGFLQKRSGDLVELQKNGKISEASFWRRWMLWDIRKSLVPKWMIFTALGGILAVGFYFNGFIPMLSHGTHIYYSWERALEKAPTREKIQEGFDRHEQERMEKMLKRNREEMIRHNFDMETRCRERDTMEWTLEHRQILIDHQPVFSRGLVFLYTGMILWVLSHGWLLWHFKRKIAREILSLPENIFSENQKR